MVGQQPAGDDLVERPEPRDAGHPGVDRRIALGDGLVEIARDQPRESIVEAVGLGLEDPSGADGVEEEQAGHRPVAGERREDRVQRRLGPRHGSALDAAFHAFATQGYRDTAVDDIAGAAETSKGGIYFHFPNKESIFRELMETTADKLVARVERAVALETEPVARAEAALHAVLTTFAGHRTMARLLFLDTMGAGRVFQAETNSLHERFARLIQGYLDEAVASGAIPPIDTRIASIAWFGALNEVVARWLLADHAGRLEDAYPALRAILLRSVGVPEERIERVAVPAIAAGADFPEKPR